MTAALDTIRAFVTPEGCELRLRVAGPMTRTRAALFDILIRFVIMIVLGKLLGELGDVGTGLLLLSYFLLEWFYPVLFEVLNGGQTPGKRICGLVVLHDDGTPVSWGASIARNLLRAADILPLFYVLGILSMLMTGDNKRLGDLVAGTVVTYIPERDKPLAASTEKEAEPPPFPLTPDEQRILLEFHRRSPRLTTERAEELALASGDLVKGMSPANARRHLLRIGNHLLGHR